MSGEASSTTLEDQIANFDPSNPESLAALEQAAMGDEQHPIDETGTTEAKQDDKPAELAVSVPSDAQKDHVKGVQAKDGQHIIPYSVLERERDRAARAEATAQALAEQLQNLQNGKMPSQADSEQSQLTAEDLDALDQDLPGVAKVIRAQMAMIDKLTGNLEHIQREQEVAQQTREQTIQDEIEAAIQGNADISAWRASAAREDNPDPLMWNRAVEVDKMLQRDPAWQDKSIAERFSKVSETMRTMYGMPAAPTTPNQQQQPNAQQAADAALKSIPAPVPSSLSDIPGGTPPASTDMETLQNASAVALGNKFMSMTPDQIESYLARMAA